MGTQHFNKEFLYAAEKLRYSSNMADSVKLETLREIIPVLLQEQSQLEVQRNTTL